MKEKLNLAVYLVLITVLFNTCDDGVNVNLNNKTQKVTSIDITPTGWVSVEVGNTTILSATAKPDNAENRNIEWVSLHENIATVNTEGVVTGRNVGAATIRAKAVDGSGINAEKGVTVIAATIKVTGITISPSGSVSITVGKTANLTATVTPSNATNKDITWSSLDPSVAVVASSTGIVTGVKEGSASIRATAADGSGVIANKIVTVAAETPGLTVSPTSLSFTSSSGQQTFTITSNVNWTLSSNADWLTVSQTSGSGDCTTTVNVTANPLATTRTATIKILGTGVTERTINVSQTGVAPTLSVSPAILNFESSSEQKTFTINSNATWYVNTRNSNDTWLAFSPSTGSNDGTITVTASTNTRVNSRTATIVVSCGSGSNRLERTIDVTQAGAAPTLTLSPTSLSFTSYGSSSAGEIIYINSNAFSFNYSSDVSWLGLQYVYDFNWNSYTPIHKLVVKAERNTTSSQRTATITISTAEGSPQQTRTVTVTQARN